MDAGNGRFVRLTEEQFETLRQPPSEADIMGRIFRCGEEVRIKGTRFAIDAIFGDGMKLKLLERDAAKRH